MKDLYSMELNSSINILYWEVTRVPSGWIYHYGNGESQTAVFVPFKSLPNEGKENSTV